MIITKFISAKNSGNLRILTVNGRGKYDPRTANECVPFGIDSNPVAGMEAIYAFTENSDKSVIVGYVNAKALAAEGEIRLYGKTGQYIWIKGDGTILMGGDSKHMVRFEELETAFNELKGKFNSLVSIFNSHTHVYVPGTLPPIATAAPVTPGTSSGADISLAKINEIKTL